MARQQFYLSDSSRVLVDEQRIESVTAAPMPPYPKDTLLVIVRLQSGENLCVKGTYSGILEKLGEVPIAESPTAP
jgi:hypothetical protein